PNSGDVRLAAAVLAKDRKATAEFVARYTGAVYSYVRSRLVPQTDLVDDLAQDVFLAAWEHLAEYRGNSPLRLWLIGIARHKVEDYYRSRLREPFPLDEIQIESNGAPTFPEVDNEIDSGRAGEKLLRILSGLPEAYRLALLWRYWERCSAREMAARTGKTEKAIERLLSRAREQFRSRWSNE
ncbi:MAG: RNA polymerase sigma factor, partial [Bryobacteraceae bacterium]